MNRLKAFLTGLAVQSHTVHFHWTVVMMLMAVDYFSTMAYAPYLSLLYTAYLAPVSTIILVIFSIVGAYSVYAMVARLSPDGQGTISLVERELVRNKRVWTAIIAVLILVAFGITDFIITITLSAADASIHLIENEVFRSWVHITHEKELVWQMNVTAIMILSLGVVFLRGGFNHAVKVAIPIVIPFTLMNLGIIVFCVFKIVFAQPELFSDWWMNIYQFDTSKYIDVLNRLDPKDGGHTVWFRGKGFFYALAEGIRVFPKQALGLSGLETGVMMMMLIAVTNVQDRVVKTRKMLLSAILLMGIMLIGSSFVGALMVPLNELEPGGSARGKVVSYLIHQHFGTVLATVYDINTILILWFAGASAMSGLVFLIPQYLLRFGMSPSWAAYVRPLVVANTTLALIVSYYFSANVEAQGGAYATGVLAMMCAGSFGVVMSMPRRSRIRTSFVLIAAVFMYVFVMNVHERPDGIKIASGFAVLTLITSTVSRIQRSTELRISQVTVVSESELLWKQLVERDGDELVLLPLRDVSKESRNRVLTKLPGSLVGVRKCFVHVTMTADPSQFITPIQVSLEESEGDMILKITEAPAVANAIIKVAMELRASSVVFGHLHHGNLFSNMLAYIFFGQGEIADQAFSIVDRLQSDEYSRRKRALRLLQSEMSEATAEMVRESIFEPRAVEKVQPLLNQFHDKLTNMMTKGFLHIPVVVSYQ